MLNSKEWVANYGDYLFSIAMMKTNNQETAEDLVQDTFLSAIKSMDTFRGESTEKTWLTRILQNKIIDYYRKTDILKDASDYITSTEKGFDENYFQLDNSSEEHWKSEALPGHWKSTADSSIHEEEFHKILELCIHKLPPKLAPVFVSKFIEEDSAKKICKDYNISSSNYWVLLHRSKLLIRSCLEKNWFSNR